MRTYSTGCKVHPDCLTCPLARCIFDAEEPSYAMRQALSSSRRQQVRRLRRSGLRVVDVAAQLGIAKRTVYRLLKATP